MQELARYESEGQEVVITDNDIKTVLTNNQNVTQKEVKMFVSLCKAKGLNPFVRDCYLVKYNNNPAQIITSKEVFVKRAFRNKKFKGFQAGITIVGTDGNMQRREGSMLLKGEQIVGGWCKVYLKGYREPMFDEVSFSEYNKNQSTWKSMPATMIRKVAICHALREAFPDDLGGLYGSEEMGADERSEQCEQTEVVEACVVSEEPSKEEYIKEEKSKAMEKMTQIAREKLVKLCKEFERVNNMPEGEMARHINRRKDYEPTLKFYTNMAKEIMDDLERTENVNK